MCVHRVDKSFFSPLKVNITYHHIFCVFRRSKQTARNQTDIWTGSSGQRRAGSDIKVCHVQQNYGVRSSHVLMIVFTSNCECWWHSLVCAHSVFCSERTTLRLVRKHYLFNQHVQTTCPVILCGTTKIWMHFEYTDKA